MKHISTILLVMVLCLSAPVVLAQSFPSDSDRTPEDWAAENSSNPQPGESIADYYKRIGRVVNSPSDITTYEEQGPNLSSGNSATSSDGNDSASSLVHVLGQFEKIINNLITWIGSIAGMIVLIMIIIGGFNYMRGDSEGGKKTLLAAIIGTIIILLAVAIVSIFKQLTGS